MRSMTFPVALFALVGYSRQAPAQILASENASVSQTVDGTIATVRYARPRARGRANLFGSRVRWGEIWTPGANRATLLEVSNDVVLEGRAVPKGKYSVWVVVQPGEWEMVLDRDTTLFHTQGPKQRAGQLRFPVKREKRAFMEALTWWFPEVGSRRATLAFQWDTVYVPLRIEVKPSYTTVVLPEVARHVVGTYRMQMEPEPTSKDTTLAAPVETNATNMRFTIRQQGDELRGEMDPPMYVTEDGYRDWILLPKGHTGWFSLGRMDKGEIIEVVDFVLIQFDQAGERARGFEIRATNDELLGKGTRVP
jgi:hypothetical protein